MTNVSIPLSSDGINKNRLFIASCFALITTAMTFAIRANILGELGKQFQLSNTELGYVNSMAFLGFPIATMIGGPLYNGIGPKKIMWVAFLGHILGLFLTIFASGFWTLLISTFFIGFANGTVEAACNPLIAELYPNDKTVKLNKFHVWFPGGIVIGSLLSALLNIFEVGWQIKIATMFIPTFIYLYLIYGQVFPEIIEKGKSLDLKKLFPPIYFLIVILMVLIAASDLTINQWIGVKSGTILKYVFMVAVVIATYMNFGMLYTILALCMTLTATTELGTTQWVEKLLGNAGASPMMVLALVTGLMAVGRYFGGPLIHKFKPIGVLLGSSLIAVIGLFLLSNATGGMTYFAAIVFAIGVCYFWPTMIGITAESTPETGALGMSFIGGIGMFATSIWQPIIGGWLDTEKQSAIAQGMSESAAELLAGQATLDNIAWFPAILVLAFGALYFMRKKFLNTETAH